MKLIKIMNEFTKDIINLNGRKWFVECTDNYMYISQGTYGVRVLNAIVPFGKAELERTGVKIANLEKIFSKSYDSRLASVTGFEKWDKMEVVKLESEIGAVYVDRKVFDLVESEKVYTTSAKGIVYFESNEEVTAIALPVYRR